MGISFLGNTSDFKTWFFRIDGKTFVANNSSTLSPLRMSFTNGKFFGNYTPEQIIPGLVLVKNHSFDIITGTSQVLEDSGQSMTMTGIVEWTWAGQKYRNRWTLSEGSVIREGVPEEGDKGDYFYDLNIVRPATAEGYVPYDGPTGGTVGGGVVSQRTVEAQQSGGTAPSGGEIVTGGGRTTTGGGVAPSGGGGLTRSAFTTTTTATGGGTPAAVAGTDWVKLGLQIGAAYLLLS